MKLRLLLLASFAAALRLGAVEIVFESPAFEIAKTSGGTALTSGYTFALGSFTSITPTAGNRATWEANFSVVPVGGTTVWDEGFTRFSGSATLSSNAGAFATTKQAYIWGYNTLTIGGSTQWILFTNPSWLFPNSATDTTSWSLADSGTVTVLGTLNATGNDPYFSTAPASAVPEPSAYAAGLGALALLGVALRRRFV